MSENRCRRTDGGGHRAFRDPTCVPLSADMLPLPPPQTQAASARDPSSASVLPRSALPPHSRHKKHRCREGSHETIRGQRHHPGGGRLHPLLRLPPAALRLLEPRRVASAAVEAGGILGARLGWDITDYGQGKFGELGLFLFTVRNGRSRTCAAARQALRREDHDLAPGPGRPMHRHIVKAEDIINRGGGKLVLELFMPDAEGDIDRKSEVEVATDGVLRRHAGRRAACSSSPGESVTLLPGIWHAFWGEGGDVLIGEVSTVNDDLTDNIFARADRPLRRDRGGRGAAPPPGRRLRQVPRHGVSGAELRCADRPAPAARRHACKPGKLCDDSGGRLIRRPFGLTRCHSSFAPLRPTISRSPPSLGIVAVKLRRNPRARNYTLRLKEPRARRSSPCRAAARCAKPARFSTVTPAGCSPRWTSCRRRGRSPMARPSRSAAFPTASATHPAAAAPWWSRTTSAWRHIVVAGAAAHLRRRVIDFMKREARRDLEPAVLRHAEAVGVRPTAIKLRDQTSRWGSCSATGQLSFSWRLVMAPPYVLDYLAAHEVAHLREIITRGASGAWSKSICPATPPQARAWLSAEGQRLHAIGAEG